MHRSGTSFLARALNLRGTYLGPSTELITDDFRFHGDNLKGHWESRPILNLAEETLHKNGGTWDEIPPKIIIDDNLGTEIKKISNNLLNHPSLAVGFKEPRIIFCLESWEKFLPANLIIVGIYRHPLRVSQSLKQRNGFTYEKSINLWKQHNEKLLLLLEKYPGFLLNFDWTKEKLFSEIDLISEKLGLSKKISLDDWYTTDLKNSDNLYSKTYSMNNDIESTLSKLDERSELNSKTTIPSISLTSENLFEIVDGLLSELKNQHDYFINIYTSNNKTNEELKKTNEELKKINDDLKKTTEAICGSTTWKTLTKIDSVRKKFISSKS